MITTCQECGRAYSRHDHLLRHIRLAHGGREQRKLQCSFLGCQKTFLDNPSLKRHVRTVHQKRFYCKASAKCTLRFGKISQLRKHLCAKHGNSQFEQLQKLFLECIPGSPEYQRAWETHDVNPMLDQLLEGPSPELDDQAKRVEQLAGQNSIPDCDSSTKRFSTPQVVDSATTMTTSTETALWSTRAPSSTETAPPCLGGSIAMSETFPSGMLSADAVGLSICSSLDSQCAAVPLPSQSSVCPSTVVRSIDTLMEERGAPWMTAAPAPAILKVKIKKETGEGVPEQLEGIIKSDIESDNSESSSYKCPFPDCQYSVPSYRRLKEHWKRHLNPYRCGLCADKVFYSYRELQEHKKKEHSTCPICGVRPSHSNMARHLRSHQSTSDGDDEGSYECSRCRKVFRSIRSLQQHTQSCENRPDYETATAAWQDALNDEAVEMQSREGDYLLHFRRRKKRRIDRCP